MTVKTSSANIGVKLNNIENRATTLKRECQNFVDIIDSGSGLDSGRIFGLSNFLSSYVSQIDNVLADADLTAIQDEARDRYNDNTINLTTDINALKTAVLSCATYIASTIPKDGTGTYYLTTVVGSNGAATNRQFTAAQLGGFVAELNGILAELD